MEDLPSCHNCRTHRVHCDYLDYTPQQIEELKRAQLAQMADRELAGADSRAPSEGTSSATVSSVIDRASDVSDGDMDADMRALFLQKRSQLELDPVGLQHFPEDDVDAKSDPMELDTTADYEVEPLDRYHLQRQQLQYLQHLQHLQYLQYLQYLEHLSPLPSLEPSLESPSLEHQHLRFERTDFPFDLTYSENNDHSNSVKRRDALQGTITQSFNNVLENGELELILPGYSMDYPVHEGQIEQPPSGTNNSSSLIRDVLLIGGMEKEITIQNPKALPNAQRLLRKFFVQTHEERNYEDFFTKKINDMGVKLAQGRASLPEIRQLFQIWLSYFIYRAFALELMFLCLLNLTTNYMITSVYQSNSKTGFRLLVHLIEHYAITIKKLLALLNDNASPELTSSISYILSLMSIYDPEATAYSTKCFRDGMFSVLTHTLHQTQIPSLSLVPIHLQLMTNIAKSVYLPAYNTSFLDEYQEMLGSFGMLLLDIKARSINSHETWSFVKEEYDQLSRFCNEALENYIPHVNDSLHNLESQEDLFFRIFRKWARHQSARLLMVNKRSDPIEKVLYLFSRLFRKALYAVMPQMRFFYLRDLDSPLFLEVFPSHEDSEIFFELDLEENLFVKGEVYNLLKARLKKLAAYAIRVLTFLKLRMSILYQNLMYNEDVRDIYRIDNVVSWRRTITDIQHTRKEFNDRIGVREYPICAFNNGYIKPHHFPQINKPEIPERDRIPHHLNVDLLKMTPNGFLKDDYYPAL